MKKNALIKFSMALTGGAIVAAFAAMGAFTFSWFTNKNNVTQDFSGLTKGAYFASGDGLSASTAYEINKPIHLYNLAWLQYLGYFNEDKLDADGNKGTDKTIDQQYYFKISADLNMDGWVLPPIGTEENPFVGIFDGGNHLITNLTISNKIGSGAGNITKHPGAISETKFNETNNPNVVGFFGVIGSVGNYSLTYDSTINAVSNFYLDGIKVYTFNTNVLCGMLAGYVNGSLSNAGVHYGRMNIASGTSNLSTYSFSNVSSFSLIGDYNKDKYSWDQDPDGGDVGYGTSTDITALHDGLIADGLNDGNVGKISKKMALPFKYENTSLVTGTGDNFDVTLYGSKAKTIKPSDYSTFKASTKGNNLGYYVGEVKTYEMSLDYNEDDFGIQSGSGYQVTNLNLKKPPSDILEYLQTKGTHLIRLNSAFTSYNLKVGDFTYVPNGQVGTYTGNLILPSNGIWVSPKESGTFKFVFYNDSYGKGGNVGFLYGELRRTKTGDFSSAFIENDLLCSTLTYSCKYGYFETTATVGREYFIGFYQETNADAPYIAYMDIGVNGGSDGDSKTTLSSFDFVEKTDDGILKITDDGYTKSGVTFKINNTNSSVATTSPYTFYFKRTSSTSVLYYFVPTSDGGFTFTPNGDNAKSGSSSDFDETTTSA